MIKRFKIPVAIYCINKEAFSVGEISRGKDLSKTLVMAIYKGFGKEKIVFVSNKVSKFVNEGKVINIENVGEDVKASPFQQFSYVNHSLGKVFLGLSEFFGFVSLELTQISGNDNKIITMIDGSYTLKSEFVISKDKTHSFEDRNIHPKTVKENVKIKPFIDLELENYDNENDEERMVLLSPSSFNQNIASSVIPLTITDNAATLKGISEIYTYTSPSMGSIVDRVGDALEVHKNYIDQHFSLFNVVYMVKTLQYYLSSFNFENTSIEENKLYFLDLIKVRSIGLSDMVDSNNRSNKMQIYNDAFGSKDTYIFADEQSIIGAVGFAFLCVANFIPIVCKCSNMLHVDSTFNFVDVKHQGTIWIVSNNPSRVQQTINDWSVSDFINKVVLNEIMEYMIRHIDINLTCIKVDKFKSTLHNLSNNYNEMKKLMSLPMCKLPNMLGVFENKKDTTMGLNYNQIIPHMYETARGISYLTNVNIVIDLIQEIFVKYTNIEVYNNDFEVEKRRNCFNLANQIFSDSNKVDNIIESFTSIKSLNIYSLCMPDLLKVIASNLYNQPLSNLQNKDYYRLNNVYTLAGTLEYTSSTKSSIWQIMNNNIMINLSSKNSYITTSELSVKIFFETICRNWSYGSLTGLASNNTNLYVNNKNFELVLPDLIVNTIYQKRNGELMTVVCNKMSYVQNEVRPYMKSNTQQGQIETLGSLAATTKNIVYPSVKLRSTKEFKSFMLKLFPFLEDMMKNKLTNGKIELLINNLFIYFRNFNIGVNCNENIKVITIYQDDHIVNKLIIDKINDLFKELFLANKNQKTIEIKIDFKSLNDFKMVQKVQYEESIYYDETTLDEKTTENNPLEENMLIKPVANKFKSDIYNVELRNISLSKNICSKGANYSNSRCIVVESEKYQMEKNMLKILSKHKLMKQSLINNGTILNISQIDIVLKTIFDSKIKNKENTWDIDYTRKKYNVLNNVNIKDKLPLILTPRIAYEIIKTVDEPFMLIVKIDNKSETTINNCLYPKYIIFMNTINQTLSLVGLTQTETNMFNKQWIKEVAGFKNNNDKLNDINITSYCIWISQIMLTTILNVALHEEFLSHLCNNYENREISKEDFNFYKKYEEYIYRKIKH